MSTEFQALVLQELESAGLVEDLESCFGSYKELAIGSGALSIERSAFCAGGFLSVEVGLLVSK